MTSVHLLEITLKSAILPLPCSQTIFSGEIPKLNQSAIEFHKEILLICHGSKIITNDKWELPVLIDQEIRIKQVLAFINFPIKSGTDLKYQYGKKVPWYIPSDENTVVYQCISFTVHPYNFMIPF